MYLSSCRESSSAQRVPHSGDAIIAGILDASASTIHACVLGIARIPVAPSLMHRDGWDGSKMGDFCVR